METTLRPNLFNFFLDHLILHIEPPGVSRCGGLPFSLSGIYSTFLLIILFDVQFFNQTNSTRLNHKLFIRPAIGSKFCTSRGLRFGGDETRSGYVQYVYGIQPNLPALTKFVDIYCHSYGLFWSVPRSLQRYVHVPRSVLVCFRYVHVP